MNTIFFQQQNANGCTTQILKYNTRKCEIITNEIAHETLRVEAVAIP